jgi:hypothetical protein
MSHDAVATRPTPPRAFAVKATLRLLLALNTIIILGGGHAPEASAQRLPARPVIPQAPDPLAGVERLQEWLTAVERHEPGVVDEPARTISLWSRSELNAALADLKALIDRASGVVSRFERSGVETTIKTGSGPLTLPDVRTLLGLTNDEIRRRDSTRIVKRGAMLHADLAVFTSLDLLVDHSLGREILLVNDGRRVGAETRGYHWDFGRMLLDAVKPDPGRDGFVRLWYHAASAVLTRQGNLAALEPHVEHARTMLPADAVEQFFRGVLHETFASPRIQSAILGIKSEIGSVESESRQAEKCFRQAVALDPAFVEARLRLGLALASVDRHEDAAAELRAAAASAREPILQYFASLLLGREEQALGHRDAARSAFEHAASLYPRAQSPYLALSQLARRSGDKAGARRAFLPVLNLPARESDREDPWWDYYISAGRHANALMTEVGAAFRAGVKQ